MFQPRGENKNIEAEIAELIEGQQLLSEVKRYKSNDRFHLLFYGSKPHSKKQNKSIKK